jgi:hypothetical protein
MNFFSFLSSAFEMTELKYGHHLCDVELLETTNHVLRPLSTFDFDFGQLLLPVFAVLRCLRCLRYWRCCGACGVCGVCGVCGIDGVRGVRGVCGVRGVAVPVVFAILAVLYF